MIFGDDAQYPRELVTFRLAHENMLLDALDTVFLFFYCVVTTWGIVSHTVSMY